MKRARRIRLGRRLDELRRRRLAAGPVDPPPWARLLLAVARCWRRLRGGGS